ncbi:pyrimidine dimer DNA glycosylase/endonuclease V [Citricoccus sp. SGAir0253]|uniref:pyrimidine dimer DNA glycosylase/endonuclease V n=1 Tax=Citricoccus sp. SGAir0253 TaxID=2567881 RepID=UPI001FEFD0E8|nr:pyrimidine dimer DNA glycosylase/endonuclease V [Citricoccus sp. SGAir0253]
MRLWTLHPKYLDRPGLTGGWREALLAQAVLAGRTRGYRSHPQLERFRAHPEPLAAVRAYLEALADEAQSRGYRFDRTRIDPAPVAPAAPESPLGPAEPVEGPAEPVEGPAGGAVAGVTGAPARTPAVARVPATEGQVLYEWEHLLAKLALRSPEWGAPLADVTVPEVHPLFVVVPGPVEAWERTTPGRARPSAARGATRPS